MLIKYKRGILLFCYRLVIGSWRGLCGYGFPEHSVAAGQMAERPAHRTSIPTVMTGILLMDARWSHVRAEGVTAKTR